ncbi:MAG: head-tail connector protein, partial [Angelakisella sp.]
MKPTQTELEAVKRYMLLTENSEDGVVEALYMAAKIYLENCGVKQPVSGDSLYNLALWGLTLFYYNHRDDVTNESSLPAGLRPIINQLKLLTAEGVA